MLHQSQSSTFLNWIILSEIWQNLNGTDNWKTQNNNTDFVFGCYWSPYGLITEGIVKPSLAEALNRNSAALNEIVCTHEEFLLLRCYYMSESWSLVVQPRMNSFADI